MKSAYYCSLRANAMNRPVSYYGAGSTSYQSDRSYYDRPSRRLSPTTRSRLSPDRVVDRALRRDCSLDRYDRAHSRYPYTVGLPAL